MLRTIFFLLVLANLLFFAWAEGYFGAAGDGREPQRLNKQLAPEKLRVVGIEPPSAATAPLEPDCRLVSGLAPGEAQRLISTAKEKLPGLSVVQLPSEAPGIIYRVYIPPLADRQAAERKLAELKSRAVTDFSLITEEGADKYAILLGQFNTELAANQYRKALTKRDVNSARVQAHEIRPVQAQLEVRGPAELLAKPLAELLGGQAAATLGDCPAVH